MAAADAPASWPTSPRRVYMDSNYGNRLGLPADGGGPTSAPAMLLRGRRRAYERSDYGSTRGWRLLGLLAHVLRGAKRAASRASCSALPCVMRMQYTAVFSSLRKINPEML
jgi:hypothetical protein